MKDFINSKVFKAIVVIVILVLALSLVVLVPHDTGKNSKKAKDKNNDSISSVEESAQDEADEELSHAEILDEESAVEDEGERIFYIPKDEVYSFSMTDSNGIVLDFKKNGKNWKYVDDESIDINEKRIDNILNYLTDVKFIDSFNTDSPADYGLNEESATYTIYDANEYATIISIGNTDENSGNVYFALNYDFSNVYVNSGKLSNVGEYAIEELIAL